MIQIDEETINKLQGRQETQSLGISKKYYIEISKILLKKWVKAVGYDIVFQNSDKIYERAFANLLEKNQNLVIATTSAIKDNSQELDVQNKCIPDMENETFLTCPGMPRSVYKNAHWGLIDMGAQDFHASINNFFWFSLARSK